MKTMNTFEVLITNGVISNKNEKLEKNDPLNEYIIDGDDGE